VTLKPPDRHFHVLHRGDSWVALHQVIADQWRAFRSAALLSRSGNETAAPCPPSTLLIEIATITARGLAGQPMKCGAERARFAKADIKRNLGYGQLTIRQ